MPKETELDISPDDNALYITANRALWAGNFKDAEELLEEFLLKRSGSDPNRVGKALAYVDPVAYSARRTLRQLRRRLKEFERLRSAAGLSPHELVSQPTMIESPGQHIRGAVWREGERVFQLRAYFRYMERDESKYTDRFYFYAARISGPPAQGTKWPPYMDFFFKTAPPVYFQWPAVEGRRGLVSAFDTKWMVEGPLFVQVSVSDFGTFVADGLWTKADLPKDGKQIISVFEDLMHQLDPR